MLTCPSPTVVLLLTSPPARFHPHAVRMQDDTHTHYALETLRAELASAVEDENYCLAARLRDDLAARESHEEAAVLCANAAFYAALRTRQLDVMTDI